MNQQLTENEIKKLLEHLSWPNQADIMQQQVFYIQTETIRQQRINDERIVEALMDIAANNPSSSARKEAIKTLEYLGVTPPTVNPKMNRLFLTNSHSAHNFAVGFFGWIVIGSILPIVFGIVGGSNLIVTEAIIFFGLIACFALNKYEVAIGIALNGVLNFLLAWMLSGNPLGLISYDASPVWWLTLPFPDYLFILFLITHSG